LKKAQPEFVSVCYNSVMQKIPIACIVVISALVVILSSGCGLFSRGTQPDLTSPELNELVKSKWTAYGATREGWAGEFHVYVMTPRGNYFACVTPESGATSAIHFRGASTTKTFTAASIMLLHQQGKLNIDDKITDLIPGSTESYVPNTADYNIPYKDEITIKMVLKHRAGIWDISNTAIPATAEPEYRGKFYAYYVMESDPTHTFTFDELVGVVATNELSYFPPDTSYHYSDTGYSMLGKIIERVSGKRYDRFVNEDLLVPNGLMSTTFPYQGNDIDLPAPLATGYLFSGGAIYENTQDNMSPHVAEGNVITTLSDLANWIRKLLRGEAGPDASTVAMMKEGTVEGAYGLGMSYVAGLGYGHDGGHAGYATVAKYDPAQDVTVLIAASVIDFDNLVPYYHYLHDMGRAAKNILGYSTAEAN
jgi:D-alanyl-D-alanine carboxypeptidase